MPDVQVVDKDETFQVIYNGRTYLESSHQSVKAGSRSVTCKSNDLVFNYPREGENPEDEDLQTIFSLPCEDAASITQKIGTVKRPDGSRLPTVTIGGRTYPMKSSAVQPSGKPLVRENNDEDVLVFVFSGDCEEGEDTCLEFSKEGSTCPEPVITKTG